MDLIEAYAFAYSAAFLGDSRKGIGATEARGLEERLAGLCEVIDVFHTEARAEHRALSLPQTVGGRRAEGPSPGQFLIRIADGKAPLVIFAHLGARIAGRDPFAETRDIH